MFSLLSFFFLILQINDYFLIHNIIFQSRDTLRLQGFKQFKWKKKQSFMQISTHLKEINEKLTLWRSSLKKIEGYYGTSVVSFFFFVKWLIFLNLIMALIMVIFVILPTFYVNKFNTTEISNLVFNISNASEVLSTLRPVNSFLNTIFDPESMVTSPFYYAYYDKYFNLNLYCFRLDLPLAYILATFMCLIYSFISVLKNAASGFKQRLLENQGQFYIYCNVVFSGWDFCIQNERSSKIKHKALYNEIVGRLNVEKRKEEQRNRTKQEWCNLCLIRIVINVLIITALIVAGFIIFLAFKFSNERNTEGDEWFIRLLVEFATAGSIISFNLIFPFIFRWLGKYERFNPILTMQITIFRTIMLRFSSLCILLGSVYKKLLQSITEVDDEMKSWESYLARELYKLLLLNAVTQVFCTFFINLPRSVLAKHCKNKFVQYFVKQEFNLSSHVLDVVYIQTIIWLGNFYAPVLPLIGVILMIIIFYVKKFACLVNCKPSPEVYYSSRSHSVYMFILLISFTFSIIPWAYSIVEIKSSKEYGPFMKYETVWAFIEQIFQKFPEWMNRAITFCVSSNFIVPLFIILLLTNYYYYAVYVVNKQMVLVLKRQLILEGHDKQFLLNRLSAFIKQQQERYHS